VTQSTLYQTQAESTFYQGCGAGAQAILDGRSKQIFRWWSRSLKFEFRFKRVIQIIPSFFLFFGPNLVHEKRKCWIAL